MSNFFLRTTFPASRFNNDLVLNKQQWQIIENFHHLFRNISYQDHRISGMPNNKDTRFNAFFFYKAFIFLTTETVGEYPYPYFTEKTWKPIVSGCPFMIVGSKHSISTLHNFGFKTFSQWWSEDYDNLETVADRVESIVDQLEKLNELSISDMQDMHNDMIPVLKHNQENFSQFIQTDLQRIKDLL